MARIFLSHSSIDEIQTVALKHWLAENGWGDEDVFLDVDPERGLAAGERWQEALRRASDRCEAVVFIVSPDWAKSKWCLAEFLLAKNLHKLIFGVVLKEVPIIELPTEMTSEWQLCHLIGVGSTVTLEFTHREQNHKVTFLADGLKRLRNGLKNAGLNAEFFPWPPKDEPDRAPYRGLEPLEAYDAAVYFGRDVEILRGMDSLRGMRNNQKKLFVILGASGAGKSSFLRAGLWPRLKREDHHFYSLSIIRPYREVISGDYGLVNALHTAYGELKLRPKNRADLVKSLRQGSIEFLKILKELQTAALDRLVQSPNENLLPTIVLSVDQAEELFNVNTENAHKNKQIDFNNEAKDFLNLIDAALRDEDRHDDKPSLIVVFTIRSDRYESLQTASELSGLQSEIFDDLKPMPSDRFREVILGPAKRASVAGSKLDIKANLVNQLITDCSEGGDTLPILGLTLATLYKDYGSDGDLCLDKYQAMGGMKQVVKKVAESILSSDSETREQQLENLRSAFIPWLATINSYNDQPMRRIAKFDDLPGQSHTLIKALADKRLLLIDKRDGIDVVEVSHEALLRQWDVLVEWLQDQRGNLKDADQLQRAAEAWNKNQKTDWLIAGERLADAELLITKPGFGPLLETCTEFLKASRYKENARREEERQRQQQELNQSQRLAEARKRTITRTLFFAGIALLFGISAVAMYSLQRDKTQEAREQTALMVPLSAEKLMKEGNLDGALLLIMDAIKVFDSKELPDQLAIGAHNVLEVASRQTQYEIGHPAQLIDADKGFFILENENGRLYRFSGSRHKPELLFNLSTKTNSLSSYSKAKYRQDKKQIILIHEDMKYEVFDVIKAKIISSGQLPVPSKVSEDNSLSRSFEIRDDGLVITKWFDNELSQNAGDLSDGDRAFSLFDIDTGASYSDYFDEPLDGNVRIFNSSKNRYIANMSEGMGEGGFVKRILQKDKTIELVDPEPTFDKNHVKFLGCLSEVSSINADQAEAIQKFINENDQTHLYSCKSLEDNIFMTYTRCGATLCFRRGTIFDKSGNTDTACMSDDKTCQEGELELPLNSPDVIAVEPESKRIAVVNYRGIKVYQIEVYQNESRVKELTDEESIWQQTAPEQVRFITSDEIMVFEENIGRITYHTLKPKPDTYKYNPVRRRLLHAIYKNQGLEPLNPGTCNSWTHSNELYIPSLGKLQLKSDSDAQKLTLTDNKNEIYTFSPSGWINCFQISSDLSTLVLAMEDVIQIHNLTKILKTKSLHDSLKDSLPFGAISAFPISDSSILIVDSSPVVERWDKGQDRVWHATPVYRGEYPIEYAEPHQDGKRMILIEDRGERNLRAFLYSVSSRSEWLTLVENYKWVLAFFTRTGEIVFGEDGGKSTLKPFSEGSDLYEEARQELSDRCSILPKSLPTDSPCWKDLMPQSAIH